MNFNKPLATSGAQNDRTMTFKTEQAVKRFLKQNTLLIVFGL